MSSLTSFLSPSSLRSFLISKNESGRKHCVGIARLVAAYYLDLPLFKPAGDSEFPSLFIWTQMGKTDIPLDAIPLSRDELSVRLPSDFTPQLPAVLLTHCGFTIEAILYADHFNDRRSSLLLRIYADYSYQLTLTNDYLDELRCEVLPKQVSAMIETQMQSSAVAQFKENVVQSILELDVVFSGNQLISLDNWFIEQLELLFAELPLHSEDVDMLPRPPVYSQPDITMSKDKEYTNHLRMHIYLQILLTSLQKSNNLEKELTSALLHIPEGYDTNSHQSHSRSVLTRVLLLILRIIYRDAFSLAIAEQSNELSNVAIKYKALIKDDDKPLEKWSSLATEQDMAHVTMFIEYLKENYISQWHSKLPPLSAFTREVWYDTMLNSIENESVRGENEWLSGIISHQNKVDRITFDQMRFVASRWTAMNFYDPSLIYIRLSLSPFDITAAKPSSTHIFSPSSPMSARSTHAALEMNLLEDRVFTPREDLVSFYAKKGRGSLGRKEHNHASINKVRYLKNTMRGRLEEVSLTQKQIEKELDDEHSFVNSINSREENLYNDNEKSFRKLASSYDKFNGYGKKLTKRNLLKEFDETIKDDLQRLNQKLDHIATQLYTINIDGSTDKSRTNSQQTEVAIDFDSNEREVDEYLPDGRNQENLGFNYEDVAAVTNGLPEIERLDFSCLSPQPQVGKRTTSTYSPRVTTSKSSLLNMKNKKLDQPDWMRLLPFGETASVRLPLLKYDPIIKRESKTERGSQTEKIHFIGEEPIDSGFLETVDKGESPRKKIDMVKPMSREEIHQMLTRM